MSLDKYPNVGQLDKQLLFKIATPATDTPTNTAKMRLGDVSHATGAALDAVFPAGTVRGPGYLQLVAEAAADRDTLAAVADAKQFGLTVDFWTDDTLTNTWSVAGNQIAAGGNGLHFATPKIYLAGIPNYGVVRFTYITPAGLTEVAVAWTPTL